MKYEAMQPSFEREERPSSGSMGSPLRKAMHEDIRIPKGKEWARELAQNIPARYIPLVIDFLKTTPPEKVEEAAHELFEAIEPIANQIRLSRYPEVEIQHCIDEVEKRLKKPN